MRNRKYNSIFRIALALGLAGLAGCGPTFDTQKGVSAGLLTGQEQWTISSSGGGFNDIQNAIDGRISTVALSSRGYRGATVTIDLGRQCMFNLIALRHGSKEFGYAGKVACLTSINGKDFTYKNTTWGKRQVTYLPLMTPVRARYIRFQVIEPGVRAWALAEIYIQ